MPSRGSPFDKHGRVTTRPSQRAQRRTSGYQSSLPNRVKKRRKRENTGSKRGWRSMNDGLRKNRNKKLSTESRVVQLREKKERRKEKKREARRRKSNETVRETAEERITRREVCISTEVNRHTQANKIWVKIRWMRRAILRMMDNVRNYVDEVHKKTAAFINWNFDVFIIPPFETQSMMKKERNDGKKRKVNATSAQSTCTWSHYRFRTYLPAVMGDRAVVCDGERYTSKTCGKCGRINHQLNPSKTFICRFEGCGFRAHRDVSAARTS